MYNRDPTLHDEVDVLDVLAEWVLHGARVLVLVRLDDVAHREHRLDAHRRGLRLHRVAAAGVVGHQVKAVLKEFIFGCILGT